MKIGIKNFNKMEFFNEYLNRCSWKNFSEIKTQIRYNKNSINSYLKYSSENIETVGDPYYTNKIVDYLGDRHLLLQHYNREMKLCGLKKDSTIDLSKRQLDQIKNIFEKNDINIENKDVKYTNEELDKIFKECTNPKEE